jgi:oxygen-dependent protoporphyrinogen oxidase
VIGIVGGGISGLFLLHFLAESGVEAILFECSASPGGVMQSRTVDGPNGPVTVDLGPQRMRLTAGVQELLLSLQLTDELLTAPTGVPFTIYH